MYMNTKMNAPKPHISIIVAVDKRWGIGRDGKIPWFSTSLARTDRKKFAQITSATTNSHQPLLIMGRKTWEDVPVKHRKMSGRQICILTRNPTDNLREGNEQIYITEMPEQLSREWFSSTFDGKNGRPSADKIFICGGVDIYNGAYEYADDIYCTHIEADYQCTSTIQPIPESFQLLDSVSVVDEDGLEGHFVHYGRV